jgi:hypothetical protein
VEEKLPDFTMEDDEDEDLGFEISRKEIKIKIQNIKSHENKKLVSQFVLLSNVLSSLVPAVVSILISLLLTSLISSSSLFSRDTSIHVMLLLSTGSVLK